MIGQSMWSCTWKRMINLPSVLHAHRHLWILICMFWDIHKIALSAPVVLYKASDGYGGKVLFLYLAQVQISADSVWEAVLTDWAKIKDAKMDVSLYTADASVSSNCSISVRRCFFDEMQVIMYESQLGNNERIFNYVNKIIRLINATLKGTQSIETSQCQKCETFQEKEYKEFMKSFGENVKRWNRDAAGFL